MQSLFGGSSQSSSGSSSSGGFNQLPQSIQDFFTNLSSAGNNLIPGATAAATPIGMTSGENTAINNINNGFVPDATTFANNIAMQQNPYDQSVIDTIQRQANGSNSLMKQAASQAGQMNSNRTLLGANDIQNTADQQIGDFKNQEYQTAANNALTTIPELQMAGANQQLQAGQDQRTVALGQSMAPITGLQQIAQILAQMPKTAGGSTSTNGSSGSSNGSAAGGIGSLLSDGLGIASFF